MDYNKKKKKKEETKKNTTLLQHERHSCPDQQETFPQVRLQLDQILLEKENTHDLSRISRKIPHAFCQTRKKLLAYLLPDPEEA